IDKTSALNGWVRIGEDDSVTVVMGKSEMGQGVFTGLGVLLAEELDARWDQVRFEQSPNDNIYNNLAGVADGLPFHPDNQGMVKSSAQWLVRKAMREMGLMFTGGSTSIKDLWLPMREAGASARAMLVGAAAQQWQVPTHECDVKDGVVSHGSGKKATFGELAAAAAKVGLPPSITLKSPDDFKLIGQSLARLDVEAKSDGSAMYVGDIRPEGLVFACVRMNPVLGGKLQSFDGSKALAMPGVKKVVAIDALHGTSAGVAVVAASTYQAMKALTQVDVKWDSAAAAEWSSNSIDTQLRQALDSDTGFAYFSAGNAADALQKATRTVKAEYHAPYLAHATMEPMACTVWFKDGVARVWASTQVPDLACKVVAKQ
ncbi:MAG: xanthine dehydrogenase family protein molybdopterin-binding subunit, partial [Betaproteobacteria bacterium]|nr:xanthine dehydrogenase family protein molybdopterin-binding subunit [Betaproteobacteria bacterium]